MEPLGGGFPLVIFIVVELALIVFLYGAIWRICTKAGRPGWHGIIPIYNYFVLAEIGKKPSWWGAMLFVPIANIVFVIMIFNALSKAFGKSEGFTVGLVLLGIVFIPILGYGDAKYVYATENESSDDLLDS